jgi:flagellar biosynthetic protein FliR
VFVDLLNWIEGEGLTYFWGGFLVFIRIGAMLALLPVFGEQMLPARIRLAAAIAFSLIAAPLVVAPKDVGFAELGTEAVAGLMLGVGLRLMIIALQIAGSIAAQSTSLAQILGIQGADPAPAVSTVGADPVHPREHRKNRTARPIPSFPRRR